MLDLLRRAGLTLGTAESVTGGLIASRLTNVPGASDVFRGAVVSYASEVKFDVLGVPDGPGRDRGGGRRHGRGGVSGARRRRGSVGVTGVAGPDSQEGVPVGTVYLAAVRRRRGRGGDAPAPGRPRAGPPVRDDLTCSTTSPRIRQLSALGERDAAPHPVGRGDRVERRARRRRPRVLRTRTTSVTRVAGRSARDAARRTVAQPSEGEVAGERSGGRLADVGRHGAHHAGEVVEPRRREAHDVTPEPAHQGAEGDARDGRPELREGLDGGVLVGLSEEAEGDVPLLRGHPSDAGLGRDGTGGPPGRHGPHRAAGRRRTAGSCDLPTRERWRESRPGGSLRSRPTRSPAVVGRRAATRPSSCSSAEPGGRSGRRGTRGRGGRRSWRTRPRCGPSRGRSRCGSRRRPRSASEKLGQPVPDSNLVSEENRGRRTRCSGTCRRRGSPSTSPVKARSVPACWVTSNCSGVRRSRSGGGTLGRGRSAGPRSWRHLARGSAVRHRRHVRALPSAASEGPCPNTGSKLQSCRPTSAREHGSTGSLSHPLRRVSPIAEAAHRPRRPHTFDRPFEEHGSFERARRHRWSETRHSTWPSARSRSSSARARS